MLQKTFTVAAIVIIINELRSYFRFLKNLDRQTDTHTAVFIELLATKNQLTPLATQSHPKSELRCTASGDIK